MPPSTLIALGFLPVLALCPAVCADPPGASRRLAAAADVASGGGTMQGFAGAPPWSVQTPALAIDSRTVLRAAFGRIYAVSVNTGVIRVIDPDTWAVVRAFDLGLRAEPLDIAVVSPRIAYVTRRSATRLLRLDLLTGLTSDAADLSPFADTDGVPDMAMMAMDQGRIFVQIQRWSNDVYMFIPPAYLAVVDAHTGALIDADPARPGVQAIPLQGAAPKFKMQVVPQTRRLFVGATGGWWDAGGVEMIDLDTLTSLGLVVSEWDGMTGADLGAFVMVSPTRGYLTFTTDFALSTHLHAFTVAGGVEPIPEYFVTLDYFAPTLVHDPVSGLLFVPDGNRIAPGVQVFDAATGARLTTSPLPTGGPPTDLLLHGAGCGVAGDFGGDGQVDGADIQAIVNCLVSVQPCICSDLNGDGVVNRPDAALLAMLLVGG